MIKTNLLLGDKVGGSSLISLLFCPNQFGYDHPSGDIRGRIGGMTLSVVIFEYLALGKGKKTKRGTLSGYENQ